MADSYSLPARLGDAGDEPVAGHAAEADPADAELAVDGPGPAAQPAAQPDADLFPRRHLDLVRLALARLELGHLPLELRNLRFGSHKCFRLLTPRGTACRRPGAVRGPRRRWWYWSRR